MAHRRNDDSGSDEEVDNDPALVRPLSSNAAWRDIQPIPQDDGPDPVAPIAYRPEFKETMDYFRAILKKNEMSERALKLTREVINGNAANYTAWHFRRLCMFHLKADIELELRWVEGLARDSPKNYQLWHHRRVLLTHLNKPLNDLAHTASILMLDAKNYHVWSHRQWLLQTFHLWQTPATPTAPAHDELHYVDQLLVADIRNNSAWNQRHFVLVHYWGQPKADTATATAAAAGAADQKQSAVASGPFSAQTISDEIEYAAGAIRKVPNNESPWNYIEGLIKKPHYSAATHGAAIIALAEAIIKQDPKCRFAHSVLFEVYETGSGDANKHRAAALQVATALAEKLDAIREKYWLWRRDNYGKALPALHHAAKAAATTAATASVTDFKSAAPIASASTATAAASK